MKCSNSGNQYVVESRYSNNLNQNNVRNNNNINNNNSNSNINQNNRINNNINNNNIINNNQNRNNNYTIYSNSSHLVSINDNKNTSNNNNNNSNNNININANNRDNNNQSNWNNFIPVTASTITYNSPQLNNNQNISNNANVSQNVRNYNHFDISSFALSSNAMNNYEIMPENPNIRSKVDLSNNNYNNVLNQLPENTIEDLNKLNEENKRCIICLSDYERGDTTIVLPCFHFFHKSCFINWYKRKASCPLCKLDIKSNL